MPDRDFDLVKDFQIHLIGNRFEGTLPVDLRHGSALVRNNTFIGDLELMNVNVLVQNNIFWDDVVATYDVTADIEYNDIYASVTSWTQDEIVMAR